MRFHNIHGAREMAQLITPAVQAGRLRDHPQRPQKKPGMVGGACLES